MDLEFNVSKYISYVLKIISWLYFWVFICHVRRQILFNTVGQYSVLGILDSSTCIYEPRHEISNNVLFATSKGSDQPAHTRSLIRAFFSRLNIFYEC